MKKTYKEFYKKSKKVQYLEIPERTYLTISGKGGPDGKEFSEAIPLLYKLAYSLRMSYKKNLFDEYKTFTVGPLEGFWTTDDDKDYYAGQDKSRLNFKLVITQPEWFSEKMYQTLIDEIQKDIPDIVKVKYEKIIEGKCVQILHIGEFANEAETLKAVFNDLKIKNLDYIPESHHEIYLSDFRRVAPEKLQTIIRYKIKY